MSVDTTNTVNATNNTTATTAQSNQQSSAAAATQNSVDYNSFLKLLIAEMKNQDPTNPSDPAQWMGQLASFSNVEQAVQTNAKLDAMMTSMAMSQANGFIGRTVTSADGSVSGKVESVRIVSGGAVATLENGGQVQLGEGVEVAG